MIKKIKNNPILLLLLGGVLLTLGDVVAATWVHSGEMSLYALVMVLYFLGMILLTASYKGEDIPVASIILVIFNITILTIVGWVFFDEPLTTTKIIGVFLGLAAVVLLQLGKKRGLLVG